MGQVSGVVNCPSVCACSSLGWDGSSQTPSDWLVLCPSLSPYPLPSSPTYFLHTAIPFTNPPSIYCPSSVLFIHSYTHPPNLPAIHPSLQVLICSLHSLLFCSIHLSIHLPIPPMFHPSFLLFLPYFSLLPFLLSLPLISFSPSFFPSSCPPSHPSSHLSIHLKTVWIIQLSTQPITFFSSCIYLFTAFFSLSLPSIPLFAYRTI